MSMSSIQEKLNRLVIPEILRIGRILDDGGREVLATSQLVLATYIQLYEHNKGARPDFYMLTLSSSALREALRSILLKVDGVTDNYNIDEEMVFLVSSLLNYEDAYYYELYDKKLGSDLMFLFVQRDEITELLAYKPIYLSGFGSLTLEAKNSSFRFYSVEDFEGNLTEDENTIPAFLDDVEHGMKLFVVGAVVIESTVENVNAVVSLKPATAINSDKGNVLVLTPNIGPEGSISTNSSLARYTFELDIPFDYRLAGAPVLTENGEFAGILTGIASDKGNMQGITARFFLDNLAGIFRGVSLKHLEEWEPYIELREALNLEEYEEEEESDGNITETITENLDNFILNLEENAEETREKENRGNIESLSAIEQTDNVKNVKTDNEGRIIVDTDEYIYLAGVREGDIKEIAEESVLPVYTELDGNIVGNGTGFIYKQKLFKEEKRTELYIITNVHVIRPILEISQKGSARITVRIDEDIVEISKAIAPKGAFLYLGLDHRFTPYDFCVLKVELGTDKKFRFFRISDKLKVKPLDEVIAIGYPLHIFAIELTFTKGHVSHVYGNDSPNPALKNTIQIDASINPGNSGGPLVTKELEVVGVNTRGLSFTPDGTPVQGMNMAIRIDHVVDTFKNRDKLEVINLKKINEIMR